MRMIRPEARRVYRELEDLRTQNADLRGEVQRLTNQISETSRIARRLVQVQRAMGLFDIDIDDYARNDASYSRR